MTVLEFPVEKSLIPQLDERKAELEELYNALNQAQGLVDKLEERAKDFRIVFWFDN